MVAACPSGTWGKDCQRDCSCLDINTECNETTGCAECPEGYTGGDCHDDIDECVTSDPCDKHANCSNTMGTFKCICDAGFTQFNATACQGIHKYIMNIWQLSSYIARYPFRSSDQSALHFTLGGLCYLVVPLVTMELMQLNYISLASQLQPDVSLRVAY